MRRVIYEGGGEQVMKLGRRLHWDPVKERFANDDQANAMLSRPQRQPYAIA